MSINWLDLDGVVNMRDLGGLPTVDGSRTRPGKLLRSDNLQDLGPTAITHLVETLDLRDVVDLRSPYEVDLEGPGPLRAFAGVAHHHLSLFPDPAPDSGPVDSLLVRKSRHRRDDDHWASHYLGYLEDRPEHVVRALRVISASEGATIVHCAAGKDRTGTVVGLALAVAGVPVDAIVADYAASAQRIDKIMARLAPREAYAAVVTGDVSRQAPQAKSMDRLFDVLESRYDGALGWLEHHGWTDSDTAALRGALRD